MSSVDKKFIFARAMTFLLGPDAQALGTLESFAAPTDAQPAAADRQRSLHFAGPVGRAASLK